LAPYKELIEDEVNVRSVVLSEDEDRFASRHLIVAFKVAAPRLGTATPATAAAAKSGDWELLAGSRARVGESILEPGEFEMRIQPVDEATTRTLGSRDGLVVLDITLTDDLLIEGLARDLVRVVQQGRRDLGLDVSDRIRLDVAGDTRALAAVETHRAWIEEQVLATELLVVAEPTGDGWCPAVLADQTQVQVRITRQPAP
jgi:isoleucyl-tRNA synthetase